MASRIGQRDHAAKRGAVHDRIDDTERVAEGANIIAPLRQVPAFSRAILAAPIATVVEIDDLGDIGQGR